MELSKRLKDRKARLEMQEQDSSCSDMEQDAYQNDLKSEESSDYMSVDEGI